MRYFLYALLLLGVILCLNKWITYFLFRMKKLKQMATTKKATRVTKHIRRLVADLYETQSEAWMKKRVALFFCVSIGIAMGFLGLMIKNHNLKLLTFIISIGGGMLPYIWVRVKLASRQITGSYEGQVIIAEVLNQYKINYFNIVEALDQSIKHLDDAPLGKQLLFRMSRELKLQSTDLQLKEILDDFTHAGGTQWGKMLATNIYFAISEDANITLGLEDILRECEQAKKMLEQKKRSNQEAFAIIKFLAPVCYLLLMGALIKFFELSIAELIGYQFFTPNGSLIFILIIILSFINMVMVRLLSKPKFDI